jgi:plasmid stabilization system protein ParE
MRVIFTPAARVELMDAYDWYEAKQPGLGIRFLDQVEATVLRLRENPQQFRVVFQDVHRALLRKFPYGLFFRVEASELVVIACFHGSRDPRRWERRV